MGGCQRVADFENRLSNIKCATRPKLNVNSGLIAVVNFVTSCPESAQRDKEAEIGMRLLSDAIEGVGRFWQPSTGFGPSEPLDRGPPETSSPLDP